MTLVALWTARTLVAFGRCTVLPALVLAGVATFWGNLLFSPVCLLSMTGLIRYTKLRLNIDVMFLAKWFFLSKTSLVSISLWKQKYVFMWWTNKYWNILPVFTLFTKDHDEQLRWTKYADLIVKNEDFNKPSNKQVNKGSILGCLSFLHFPLTQIYSPQTTKY